MVQDVDPDAGVEGGKEQDGTNGGQMKPARTPDNGHQREDDGCNPGKDAESVAADAGQYVHLIPALSLQLLVLPVRTVLRPASGAGC